MFNRHVLFGPWRRSDRLASLFFSPLVLLHRRVTESSPSRKGGGTYHMKFALTITQTSDPKLTGHVIFCCIEINLLLCQLIYLFESQCCAQRRETERRELERERESEREDHTGIKEPELIGWTNKQHVSLQNGIMILGLCPPSVENLSGGAVDHLKWWMWVSGRRVLCGESWRTVIL